MKRGVNFYELLFLSLLLIKGLHVQFFGVYVSWFAVFGPLIYWALYAITGLLSSMFGWEDRIKFIFWKWATNFNAKKAANKVRKEFSKSSNPGQYREY